MQLLVESCFSHVAYRHVLCGGYVVGSFFLLSLSTLKSFRSFVQRKANTHSHGPTALLGPQTNGTNDTVSLAILRHHQAVTWTLYRLYGRPWASLKLLTLSLEFFS